jgi:hypothetical protein
MFVCLYVCLYLIQIHISEPIGTKFCTRLPLGLEKTVRYVWARNSWSLRPFGPLFFRGRSWGQDGCRRDRFLRYPYIRGSSWCWRDVTDITLSLAAESSAAVLYPWFYREFPLRPRKGQNLPLQRPIPYSGDVCVTSRILRSKGRRAHPPQRYITHSSSCFCGLQKIASLQTTVVRFYSKCVALSVMRTIRWDVNGIHVSTIPKLIRRKGSD